MTDEETNASAEPETADDAQVAPEVDLPPEAAIEQAVEAPASAGASSGEADGRGLKKTRVGVVVSDSMSQTIVVKVTRRVPHPEFKKIIKRSSTFYAHDENGHAKLGDKVRIIETRPLSKLKRWRLLDVLAH
jgi:small subunit ribosomal protein S17